MKFGIRKLESWGYQIVKKSWHCNYTCNYTMSLYCTKSLGI